MLQVLRSHAAPIFGRGPFRIRRVRPGLIDAAGEPPNDPAFGPLSVIDHATLDVGTRVPMHEHRDDEILSYLWRGEMVHEDSTGQRVTLSPRRLMMMNAGRGFSHEESVPDAPVEMLQIFVRPGTAGAEPDVRFYERPDDGDDAAGGGWTLIGGEAGSDAPLTIRNRVRVYDARPRAGQELTAPAADGMRPWVYVMDGAVAAGDVTLEKGDAVADPEGPLPPLRALSDATLVAFLADPSASGSLAGTISGR